VIARGVARSLLSRYLNICPSEVVFEYGEFGKPALDGRHESKLCFNVSHTDTLLAIAISTDIDVGIDIEPMSRTTEHDDLVARYFCQSEQAAFDELAAHLRPRTFLNAWTRKEAYLKAVGTGLSEGLDRGCVTLKPGESAEFLDDEISRNWTLHELSSPQSHVGALVYRGKIAKVTSAEWTIDELK
jgi:4'-phosphopantetheinyl transferase